MQQGMVLLYDFVLEEDEFCRLANVSHEEFLIWKDMGVVEPVITEGEIRFPAEALAKLVKAKKIQHDFELDFSGTSLVLDLLEEIALLRQKLKRYEND
jgi:chaperone modulatory protein CbpM